MARIPFHRVRHGLRVFGQYTVGISATGSFGFYLWTKNCYFEPFGPENDALFKHPLLKQINPNDNPSSYDLTVRAIPFSKIKPTLLENAQQGGSELIEAFCAGVWGGYGKSSWIDSARPLLTSVQAILFSGKLCH